MTVDYRSATETSSRLAASISETSGLDNEETFFPDSSRPPLLAIVTERSACDSPQRVQETLGTLSKAISTELVDLIYVRVSVQEDQRLAQKDRLVKLIQQLVSWSSNGGCSKEQFRVVINSDWIDASVESGAHGVHFKETHRHLIPEFLTFYCNGLKYTRPLIGTSAHSVESALDAWEKYRPDYYFVGTCYWTESHPEKSIEDLEGPELPGKVKSAVLQQISHESNKKGLRIPFVFAIGGIDTSNCRLPLYGFKTGADGVAVIRAVLTADPAKSVVHLKRSMR